MRCQGAVRLCQPRLPSQRTTPHQHATMATQVDVIVVGGGAAGLSVGAVFKKKYPEIKVVILEACDRVGSTWAVRYSRLHLHTPKTTSSLPYKPYPKSYPLYPSKDQVQEYLESYAREFELDVRLRHVVTAITPKPLGAGYRVSAKVWEEGSGTFSGVATSAAPAQGKVVEFESKMCVLATGPEVVPLEPKLPGRDAFQGPVVHSTQYKDGAPYKGKRVLVVGFGNSAGEIALCLSEHGALPTLLVRKPKAVVIPRDDGLATSLLVKLDIKKWLKPYAKWLDKVVNPVLHVQVPNLRPYGVPQVVPAYFGNGGIFERIISKFDPPMIDVGQVAAIRKGAIRVMRGELRGFSGPGSVLVAPPAAAAAGAGMQQGPEAAAAADEEGAAFGEPQPHAFDAVVLCTGYDHTATFRRLLPPEVLPRVLAPGGKRPAVSGAETGQPGLFILGWDDLIGRLAMIGQEAHHVCDAIVAKLQE